MKIKSDFILQELGNQYVVVPLGERSKEFNGIIRLNKSGRFLWEQLSHECTKEQLLFAMLSQYDIDEDTAKKDLEEFLGIIQEAGILEM